jgi:hypothetical protein
LVLKHISRRVTAAVILQSFWIIGILTLFCDFVSYPEPSLVRSEINFTSQSYSQSLETLYIKSSNQDYSLSLNAGSRFKKVTLTYQQSSNSARQYLVAGWIKTLKTLTRSKFVFDSRIQPSFLLLDKPPPSYPV